MNHHILTVHKSDYTGDIEQLELALSIRIESIARAAFLARTEDETTHELTLLNGTWAQAADLRQFAEGVMLAQELAQPAGQAAYDMGHDLLEALEAITERAEAVAEGIHVEKRNPGVSQAQHVRHMANHLAQHAKIARHAIDRAKGA